MKRFIIITTFVLLSNSVYSSDSSKTWNVEASVPLETRPAIRYSLEYLLDPAWSIGARYLYSPKDDNPEFDVDQYGLFGTYWWSDSFLQGWYTSAFLNYSQYKFETGTSFSSGYSTANSGVSLAVEGGYSWSWNYFNTSIGFMASIYPYETDFDYEYPNGSGHVTVPHSDPITILWSMGVAF